VTPEVIRFEKDSLRPNVEAPMGPEVGFDEMNRRSPPSPFLGADRLVDTQAIHMAEHKKWCATCQIAPASLQLQPEGRGNS
jgi:hypothetical protein